MFGPVVTKTVARCYTQQTFLYFDDYNGKPQYLQDTL